MTLHYEPTVGMSTNNAIYDGKTAKLISTSRMWCTVQIDGKQIKWALRLVKTFVPKKTTQGKADATLFRQQMHYEKFIIEREKTLRAKENRMTEDEIQQSIYVSPKLPEIMSGVSLRKLRDEALMESQLTMTLETRMRQMSIQSPPLSVYRATPTGTTRKIMTMNTDLLKTNYEYIIKMVQLEKPDIFVACETPASVCRIVGEAIGPAMFADFGKLLYSGDEILIAFNAERFTWAPGIPVEEQGANAHPYGKFVHVELVDKVAHSPLLIVAVHLPHRLGTKRDAAVKNLQQFIEHKNMPTIVLGDFNRSVGILRREFPGRVFWVQDATTVKERTKGIDNIFCTEKHAAFSYEIKDNSPYSHRPIVFQQIYNHVDIPLKVI